MPFISSRAHGVWDYVAGLALIAAPWLFGFADDTAATYVPVCIGLAILGLTVMTNFELGLAKIVPLSTHLMLDIGAGALLAASPWLFGFADYVYMPHLVVGITEILIALMTVKVPYRSTRLAGVHEVRT